MTKPKRRRNDAAVDDALALDHLDKSRHVYLPDGSVELFDEQGNLVERLVPTQEVEK